MIVTCRRDLMEIDVKITEQLRNCSGISEIFGPLEQFHSGNGSNTGLSRRNAERRVSDAAVSVSSE